MATFKTGPPNFLVPGWMFQPINDPDEVRSGITPRAIHKIMYVSRRWKVNADVLWSVDGIFPNTYGNVGEAHLGDEEFGPLGGAPIDEKGIETSEFGSFGAGSLVGADNTLQTPYEFTDGAVSPTATLLSLSFGGNFQWIDMRNDRANTWETEELELSGNIRISSPSDAYTLAGDGVTSEPSDIGFTPRDYALPIAWQSGEPGTIFYGEAHLSDAWTDAGYNFTFDLTLTLEPILYWGWDGKYDTATGLRL